MLCNGPVRCRRRGVRRPTLTDLADGAPGRRPPRHPETSTSDSDRASGPDVAETSAPSDALQPSDAEGSIGSRDLTQWRTAAGQWLSRTFGALADRVRNAEVAVLLLLGLSVVLAVGGTVLAGEIYESVSTGHGIALVDEPLLGGC